MSQLAESHSHRSVGRDDDVLAVVAGEHEGVIGQGKDLVVERVVQVVSELLGPVGQVRPADAVDEQGVARQHEAIGDDVDRRSTGMTGRVDGRHPEADAARELEAVLVTERLVGEIKRVRRVEVDGRPRLLGQQTRTAQVIGVEVGVEHADDPPSVFVRQSAVHLRIERRIDDEGLVPRSHQIRQAPLGTATDLYDAHLVKLDRDGVVDHGPRGHAAGKIGHPSPAAAEDLRRRRRAAPAGAHGDHVAIGGHLRDPRLELTDGDVHGGGDRPSGELDRLAHVEDERLVRRAQPCGQFGRFGVSIHQRTPWFPEPAAFRRSRAAFNQYPRGYIPRTGYPTGYP